MDKTKKEIVITVVLTAVLLILAMNNVNKKRVKKPSLRKDAMSGPLAEIIPGAVPKLGALDEKALQKQKERANMKYGKDPFQLSQEDAAYSGIGLELKGISLGKDRMSYATINQEIVKVGDSIEGYKVARIERGKVLLEKDSQSFYLLLPDELTAPETMQGAIQ